MDPHSAATTPPPTSLDTQAASASAHAPASTTALPSGPGTEGTDPEPVLLFNKEVSGQYRVRFYPFFPTWLCAPLGDQ